MFASPNPSLHRKQPSRMKRLKSGRTTCELPSPVYHAKLTLACSKQTDPLTESIRLLNSLARKLRAGRMAAGALNLASPEVKIHMESSESSDPVDVEQKELRETNSLVEEFMLLANASVASKIQETFPQTAVLRYVPASDRHPLSSLPCQTPHASTGNQLRDASRCAHEAERTTIGLFELRCSCCFPGSLRCKSDCLALADISTTIDLFAGCQGARVQYSGTHHGNAVYEARRILFCGLCLQRDIRTLRSCNAHIHTFHQPHPSICW